MRDVAIFVLVPLALAFVGFWRARLRGMLLAAVVVWLVAALQEAGVATRNLAPAVFFLTLGVAVVLAARNIRRVRRTTTAAADELKSLAGKTTLTDAEVDRALVLMGELELISSARSRDRAPASYGR